jgi:hypothetical protein
MEVGNLSLFLFLLSHFTVCCLNLVSHVFSAFSLSPLYCLSLLLTEGGHELCKRSRCLPPVDGSLAFTICSVGRRNIMKDGARVTLPLPLPPSMALRSAVDEAVEVIGVKSDLQQYLTLLRRQARQHAVFAACTASLSSPPFLEAVLERGAGEAAEAAFGGLEKLNASNAVGEGGGKF